LYYTTYFEAMQFSSPGTFLFILAGCTAFSLAQEPASGPVIADHDKKRAAEVDERGDQAMGFSHDMTTHHFHLLRTGGAIEVETNNPSDAQSRNAVRDHMAMIAGLFSQGDFSLPMFIHATTPPGIETMKRLKTEITYHTEDTARGARVRITTENSDALKAIHDFLRFQIEDHRTNDPLEVQQ
jgi:hypothetical protein